MMLPIFEPVMLMFQPVATGLLVLAAGAVGGILAVVALVALDARPRTRTGDGRPMRDLPEAA